MTQNDRLLSEAERQKKYEDELGNDYSFPLFNSRKALESQRRSGYRNSAAAGREIVDNSLEAGATKIHVVMDRQSDRKVRQRRDAVGAIAFIDNGSGMRPRIARYALSWGGGTHFDDPNFIGKFGFGLPNASINQSRRVEVYTRMSADQPFTKVWLDIDEYKGEGVLQQINPGVESELPGFVQRYIDKMGWKLEHGTVVVWSKPDRITYSTVGSLREHLVDDFGVTYRYLLEDIELIVDEKLITMVDPLFLEEKGRFYRKESEGGAIKVDDTAIPVKYSTDPKTGEQTLTRVESADELNDPNIVAAGAIHVRVARFPLGLVIGRDTGIPPIDDLAGKRFDIRKTRRGMSFVRSGREIETVDAFPRRQSDKASGLGDWPLLQGYAYHWGIEVRFTPTLDEVFGITNDKQTVRPIEHFWRLLKEEGYDALLNRENSWQESSRNTERKRQNTAKQLKEDGDVTATPAEMAAQTADVSVGTKGTVPNRSVESANLNLENRVQENAKQRKHSVEEARKVVVADIGAKRYDVQYVDDPNGPFYTPVWVGRQAVVRVNKKHPFFETLYGALLEVEGGKLAKEAVDLMLIALSRGELMTANDEMAEFYRAQRVNTWSPFLDSSMRTLARAFPDDREESAA